MNLHRKHLVTFVVLVLFVVMSVMITAADKEKIKYRSEVLKELEKVEAAFNQSTDDEALRKEYAKLLFQTGDFWNARDTVTPLLKKSKDVETLILGARLTPFRDQGNASLHESRCQRQGIGIYPGYRWKPVLHRQGCCRGVRP